MVANQPHAEGNLGFQRKANRRWHPGVWHRDNHVRVDRMLARQQPAKHLARLGHAATEDDAVRPRKIYMFENAVLVWLWRAEPDRLSAHLRNAQHLARFHF